MKIPHTPWRFLWFAIKPHKWLVFLAIFLEVTSSVLNQNIPYLYKLLVDFEATSSSDSLLYVLLGIPVAVVLVQLCHRLSNIIIKYPILWAYHDASVALPKYALQHSHAYFSDRQSGSLMKKVTTVADSIDMMLQEIVYTYISVATMFITTAILLSTVDGVIALLFVTMLIVLTMLNIKLVPIKRKYSRENADAGSRLSGEVVDIFANSASVRLFTNLPEEEKRIKKASQLYTEIGLKSWRFTDMMFLLNTILLFVFLVPICLYGYYLWTSNAITAGDLTLTVSVIIQLSFTIVWIGRAFTQWAKIFGNFDDGLKEVLIPHEIVDRKESPKLTPQQGEIIWHDVTFSYGGNAVFNSFNLTIPPAERLGLVGPSGAGKSTFVSLLLRQYDIENGSIEIDGQNIALVTQDSLREAMAVVPQEPALFHRTIRENIAYGKPEATDEEIIAVAKKAYAHDFVTALPLGYDTLVGERGVKLSGGQKQRIAIARAMLKDAPILILDEATSALDSESEVEIQKALHALMAGKTVIAIAHRLSTLREMDRIIVLEDGRITEDGTHDSLLTYGGTYSRLWAHQAGGFLEN